MQSAFSESSEAPARRTAAAAPVYCPKQPGESIQGSDAHMRRAATCCNRSTSLVHFWELVPSSGFSVLWKLTNPGRPGKYASVHIARGKELSGLVESRTQPSLRPSLTKTHFACRGAEVGRSIWPELAMHDTHAEHLAPIHTCNTCRIPLLSLLLCQDM